MGRSFIVDPKKYPQTIFWKDCVNHAYVSDQLGTVLALCEQVEHHTLPPSYQKLKTMVKRYMDQKIRARKLPAKARSLGKPISVDRKQRECCQWKAKKGSVQKEKLAVSATTTVSVGKQHNCPLLLQDRRDKVTGTNLWKGKLSEAVVPLERDLKDRAEITLMETVRTRHVILGIHPHVDMTKHNRDADL